MTLFIQELSGNNAAVRLLMEAGVWTGLPLVFYLQLNLVTRRNAATTVPHGAKVPLGCAGTSVCVCVCVWEQPTNSSQFHISSHRSGGKYADVLCFFVLFFFFLFFFFPLIIQINLKASREQYHIDCFVNRERLN